MNTPALQPITSIPSSVWYNDPSASNPEQRPSTAMIILGCGEGDEFKQMVRLEKTLPTFAEAMAWRATILEMLRDAQMQRILPDRPEAESGEGE